MNRKAKSVSYAEAPPAVIDIEVKPANFILKDDDGENVLKPNYLVLGLYLVTLGLGSLQLGWVNCGNTQVAPILIK